MHAVECSSESLHHQPPSISLNTDHDGRLTGADAVKFFERSGLPRDQLAKVWAMADSSRRGYLDQQSFAMVRRAGPRSAA